MINKWINDWIIRLWRQNKLNPNTKKVASFMSLYKFKQRLNYKCSYMRKGYSEVNEAYTSKTCSNCAANEAKL